MTRGVRNPGSSPSPDLGFWTAVALVMGNMIGSGIFLLPASLASYGGLSLVGWLISTVGALALALVFARLAGLNPAAGGPYAYTRQAFGDLPAFLVAWGYWISIWTSLAALAVALVGYLAAVVPAVASTPRRAALTAIVAVWLPIGINLAGVRHAGRAEIVTTALKVLPLALVGGFGLFQFEPDHFSISRTDALSLLRDVPGVAVLTLWAFLGLESATVPAGAIEDPGRTIPRATVIGTGLTAALYVVTTVGVMSVLEPSALGQSAAPFADTANALAGPWAGTAIAVAAVVSCFGALNGWTLLAGQLPMAVAADGLFPEIFRRVSRNGTPSAGLIIAGVLTTGLVVLNHTRGLVELFTAFILLATFTMLVPYVFCSLALFLVRGGPGTAGRSTGNLAAAIAFGYSLWAMGGAGMAAVYWGFLMLMCGLPVYVWIVRRRHS
jgi:APA family basic amino acid/polyamine antiporter